MISWSRLPGLPMCLTGVTSAGATSHYEHAIQDDRSTGVGTARTAKYAMTAGVDEHLRTAGATEYVDAAEYTMPIGTTGVARFDVWGGPAGTVRQHASKHPKLPLPPGAHGPPPNTPISPPTPLTKRQLDQFTHFCTSMQQFYLQNCTFPFEDHHPYLIQPHPSTNPLTIPNGTRIQSAVLPQYTFRKDRHTDTDRQMG